MKALPMLMALLCAFSALASQKTPEEIAAEREFLIQAVYKDAVLDNGFINKKGKKVSYATIAIKCLDDFTEDRIECVGGYSGVESMFPPLSRNFAFAIDWIKGKGITPWKGLDGITLSIVDSKHFILSNGKLKYNFVDLE